MSQNPFRISAVTIGLIFLCTCSLNSQNLSENIAAEKAEAKSFNTPLSLDAAKAIRVGDVVKLQKLIREGLDVDYESLELSMDWGQDTVTLLLWAAIFNQPEVAEALLKAGANPDKSTRRGVTPLMVASSGESDSLFSLLCNQFQADPNKISELVIAKTALIAAIQDGNKLGEKRFRRASMLLARGAKLDLNVDRGATALIILARHRQWEPVYWLLEQGTDYEKRDFVKSSAMCYLRNSYRVNHAETSDRWPYQNKVRDWFLSHGVARSRVDPALHPDSKCDD